MTKQTMLKHEKHIEAGSDLICISVPHFYFFSHLSDFAYHFGIFSDLGYNFRRIPNSYHL